MICRPVIAFACTIALLTIFAPERARAQDTLKVAIGQMETWTNQGPQLGQTAGIFKKHGLVLENFATQGAGETLQAVISGAADLGIGVGTVGAMRAFARGAPIRIIAPSYTGAGDLYWYVRADSPIKTLKDATERNTIAYSTNGASTHIIVLGFGSELGVKAKPTATGGLPATFTQVMSGQIDIGWASPPFALKDLDEGKIRLLAVGNDVPSLRGQTVRVEIVNAEALKNRKDVMRRFAEAYAEAVAFMYNDPQAMKNYAAATKIPERFVQQTIDRFQTKQSKQLEQIAGVDSIMADGVKLKLLDRPLTKDELAELIQFPVR